MKRTQHQHVMSEIGQSPLVFQVATRLYYERSSRDMARPFKESESASHDWETRAEQARISAETMPEGPERTTMLRKIELLRVGAEMRRALSLQQA